MKLRKETPVLHAYLDIDIDIDIDIDLLLSVIVYIMQCIDIATFK